MTAARSYLFVPGNRPDRFAKACASGADAVIIDLEDAVPASEREAARTHIANWLSPDHPVLIRISGLNEDLALCEKPGVAGVVLPKAERIEDLAAIPHTRLFPIIETARGFWNVSAIAHAPNVQRLMFGHIDFQFDLGIQGDGEELLYFRSQLVLVSRIAGLAAPVYGITTTFHTSEPVREDTRRARRLGFGGKLCIHPSQVPIVNECFDPTLEEIAWAKRVVEATAGTRGEAISLDGEMIDRPVVDRAQAILAQITQP